MVPTGGSAPETMRVHRALLALLLVPLAGCATTAPEPEAGTETAAPAAIPRPVVVIALIDSGINPYHSEFRDADGLMPDPAAVIPGYPGITTRIALSLDAPTYKEAVERDRVTWGETTMRTLYWFAGTRIAGAIEFPFDATSGLGMEPGARANAATLDSSESLRDSALAGVAPTASGSPAGSRGSWAAAATLDDLGHGTMTSSRAGGNSRNLTSLGGPDVLLVMVQGISTESVQWIMDQPWIDIVSVSYGDVGGSVPVVGMAFRKSLSLYARLAHERPVFAAASNGFGNLGLLGYPSSLVGFNGLPDVITVGANDNANVAHWGGWNPYVTADGCGNPAARAATMDEVTNEGGGTSSATPFTAGGAARILLEARRVFGDLATGPRAEGVLATATDGAVLPAKGPLADGVFTLDELKQVLFHTAVPIPGEDASDGDECSLKTGGSYVPADATTSQFAFVGYGEVNAASVERAVAVLRGVERLPERAEADAAYERERATRELLYGPLLTEKTASSNLLARGAHSP